MPTIGEIKQAKELGKKANHGYGKYIFYACEGCGKKRWVLVINNKPADLLCQSCANRITSTGRFRERHNAWRGGLTHHSGYVYMYRPEHPRAHNGYIKRAILVLEERLGRPLLAGMDGHHINGVKDDDRPENLMGLSRSTHMKIPRRKKKQLGGINGS